ncbi:acyltransferase family protein [Microlunatus sp. Y2014]|uniref:acyltransferase family protein n=1 Tax=Microlunatus sp. Y2014 TaxID=3418488 RepID=UPI003DA6FC6E
MTVTATREQILAKRDLALDLVRVACLLLVVAAHVCFVALRTTSEGAMENWTPPQQYAFFAVGTWFVQPMPLFFLVGGCVSLLAWRSARRRGEGPYEFFRTRLVRFTYPAFAFLGILAVIILVALLLGVPKGLADAAAYGAGTPLWFMGAYLLCQAILPAMAVAHERRPLLTPALLLLAALVVDVVRGSVGIDAIGLINYLFVWPFAQQLGFLLADGWFDPGSATTRRPFAVHIWQLILLAAFSFLAVGVVATTFPFGPDMLQNQIPPSAGLAFIGLAHVAVFRFVKPVLTHLMEQRWAQGVAYLIGSRAMTIYLWHAVFVIGIAALFYFGSAFLPQAPSVGWWLLRLPVFLVVLGLVLLISSPLARLERGPRPAALPMINSTTMRLRVVAAGVLAVVPAFATTIPTGDGHLRGLDADLVLLGAALLVLSILLVRVGRRGGPAPDSRGDSGAM